MPVLTKINTNVIADNAVTSAKIPADAVIASDIAPNITLTGDYVGIPSATTTERDALTAVVGMLVYNSTIGIMQQYAGNGWASIDSPPTVSSLDYPGDDTALDTVGEYNDATCDYNNDPTIAHDANSNMKVGMSVSGTGIPVGATIDSVTSTTAFELSASTTGGAVTNGTLTFNTQTLVITGTNFSVGATVTIDGTAPSTVTRNSSSQITVTGTPTKTAGTKVDGLVVSNTSGLSAAINVDYSALPAWTTASGNLLDAANGVISTIDLAATSATSYAITSGALPGGLAMSTSTGDITGTMSGSVATYNFTVTATDAEAQSAPRLFNIINQGTLPTGGTITTYSGFRVHTFTSGTVAFVVTDSKTCDILIVGGGGGGTGGTGGGGGGGAVIVSTSSITIPTGSHNVTIGVGGAVAATMIAPGLVGGDTTFALSTPVVAKGGGPGMPEQDSSQPVGGANSGGGVLYWTPDTVAPVAHSAFSGYTIHAGNTGGDAGSRWDVCGGGAGAGGDGGDGNGTTKAGNGGPGVQIGTWYNGSTNHFWGGGGGGGATYSTNGGDGGTGGGGGGGCASGATAGVATTSLNFNNGTNGTAGTPGGSGGANTGGGGGGNQDSGWGGPGGSGIVIIRYAV